MSLCCSQTQTVRTQKVVFRAGRFDSLGKQLTEEQLGKQLIEEQEVFRCPTALPTLTRGSTKPSSWVVGHPGAGTPPAIRAEIPAE
jgi:hypothetical protein